MASITLKSLPASLHRALKTRAAKHKRSLNSEVMAMLENQLAQERPLDVQAMLERARRFRASLNFTITDEEINRLKREGRP